MTQRVLIIGGYGNFGSFISRRLAEDTKLQVIIAGRSLEKARHLAQEIGAEAAALDISADLTTRLQELAPDIVVHTSGPFQAQGYDVAQACIAQGAHYIDLSDGRAFVQGITALDGAAKESGVLVVSGASSVPCLTAALLDHYSEQFSVIREVDYGITTAQKTARGLATTEAILGYTGRSFDTMNKGELAPVYGWQGIRLRRYKGLGLRFLGNCDVPDLALFPERYQGLETLRFYAGLELWFVHLTLWGLSWLVRAGLVTRLERYAPIMLRLSHLFDWLGSSNSGFHMTLKGTDKAGVPKGLTFEMVARSGDGPFIPCMPSILLVKLLAHGGLAARGAQPCVGLIDHEAYLGALGAMDISWSEWDRQPS